MYKIVIPKKASKCECFAAEELKSFIFKATGTDLEVIKDSRVSDADCFFSVGKTKQALKNGINLSPDEVKHDGFMLKRIGNIFYICGARDRGTLYGVYDVLERFFNVRFVSDDCTYIPKSVFTFPEIDLKVVPEFEMRSFFCKHIRDNPLFSARMRMAALWGEEKAELGYGLKYDFYDTVHNTLELVPPSVYFEEHPEFFTSIDLKTAKELCFSHGITDGCELDDNLQLSTVKIAIESIKQLAHKYPNARYFMIGQQDSVDNYCRCGKCNAIYKKYGAHSATIIRFCNVVAREIKKWAISELNGREINIVTFAYSFSEYPPVSKNEKGEFYALDRQVIFEDNLAIRIAAADANYVYSLNDSMQRSCKSGKGYIDIVKGWSVLAKKIMVWDYNSNFTDCLWYYPNLRVMKKNLEFYKSLNAVYVFNEASVQDQWQTRLKCYLSKNLMWNLSLDVNTLLKEYCDIYYGCASPYVMKVIKMYEDRVTQLIETDDGFNIAQSYINKHKHLFKDIDTSNIAYGAHMYLAYWALDLSYEFFPVNLLKNMTQLLKDAIKVAENSQEIIKRVAAVMLTPMRMIQLNYYEYYNTHDKTAFSKEFLYYCKLCGQETIGLNVQIPELNKKFGSIEEI